MEIFEFLNQYNWWGNSLYDYLFSLCVIIGVIIVLKVFQLVIIARLKKLAKKTKTDIDDVLIDVIGNVKASFYFVVAFYLGLQTLVLPEDWFKVINIIFLIYIVYEIIRAIVRIVDFAAAKYLKVTDGKEDKRQSKSMIRALTLIAKIILWSFGLILILGNMGVDVTSLIAGIGIGGIAIALALQNILSDVFCAFSIYIDKPFITGDYIVVGSDSGTVEHIGLKTTRIRTLQGEELIVANQELTTARVQNFKSMEQRRITMVLGVVYGTPIGKLKNIPKIVKGAIKKAKIAEFVRCYFESYGDSSLNYKIVYTVNSSEFEDAAKVKEKINYEIYREFNKEGIEFAYPTQTLEVNMK